MRAAFSRLLTQAARQDARILLLTGDHGYALFDEFRRAVPDQFINCGVAEQNMVGVAAGLAMAGFRPIVYGLSAFVPIRVLEQIKLDVCYANLPVCFVGDGAGVVYAQLGTSHQSTEDVAALRAVPNIDIQSPSDKFELEYCFSAFLDTSKPIYLRFGKSDCGDIHDAVPMAADVPKGDLIQVRPGAAPFAFVATGSMVSRAVQLADAIGGVPVWSAPYLEPFNRAQLHRISAPFERIFTFEEHSTRGGLGSLVAEVLSESSVTRVTRFGIDNRFSETCGNYAHLMEQHGLGIDSLRMQVAKLYPAVPTQPSSGTNK
ncbi:transketolase [Pandoraea aquatica]|uniref:Transketolase n=1 Tax=Pandoraea aquatica TaxID=2508290 RepID=A0A5E4Z4L8_9BURK|nr:transketolase C-terminal domain-containing protein [Pandoraea aquatica]VVE56039.1 transketolase [Pandoraea aquatica]